MIPRSETTFPLQFATTFDVQLTPLPCLQHLSADQRQAKCRRVVGEIRKAEAENKEKRRQPMGVAAILAQDPHGKPAATDRSPTPFVHATDDSTEQEFRVRYRAFVDHFAPAPRAFVNEPKSCRTCLHSVPSRRRCRSTLRPDGDRPARP